MLSPPLREAISLRLFSFAVLDRTDRQPIRPRAPGRHHVERILAPEQLGASRRLLFLVCPTLLPAATETFRQPGANALGLSGICSSLGLIEAASGIVFHKSHRLD